jgi:hypothetical protein
MELQEGDGLMAGSRRRENLPRRTFCGRAAMRKPRRIRTGVETNSR